MIAPQRLHDALRTARQRLLQERLPEGYWEGRLSSSPLSTATALSALALAGSSEDQPLIADGVNWLAKTQNPDGGWGDTADSPSNLATSLLALSALTIAAETSGAGSALAEAETYISRYAGATPSERVAAVSAAYGDDRTFAVPILVNCALAGLVSWKEIPGLPVELAALPQGLYRAVRMQVVSYALPALITVGLLLHHHNPPRSVLRRLAARLVRNRIRRKLALLQPENGGFLEAIPLTAFVAMSLIPVFGPGDSVVRKCLDFLRASARDDGSWPIDTNLSVWVTTNALTALTPWSGAEVAAGSRSYDCEGGAEVAAGSRSYDCEGGAQVAAGSRSYDCEGDAEVAAGSRSYDGKAEAERTRAWIAASQHRRPHPFTGARPGGWAWTHLPGGVPDADDTAGAVLALGGSDHKRAIVAGIRWLMGLQNPDGGWPTFCRGWGRLPFDRSCPDITAHALRALHAASGELGTPRAPGAISKGLRYLARAQRAEGSWVPLWFGNQAAAQRENPVLGTARVLMALAELAPDRDPAHLGLEFLASAQNPDGGWGGEQGIPSSVEETALAVSALSNWPKQMEQPLTGGVSYLLERVEDGSWTHATPIGLYFARLWYSEELYPVIWTVEALGRACTALGCS